MIRLTDGTVILGFEYRFQPTRVLGGHGVLYPVAHSEHIVPDMPPRSYFLAIAATVELDVPDREIWHKLSMEIHLPQTSAIYGLGALSQYSPTVSAPTPFMYPIFCDSAATLVVRVNEEHWDAETTIVRVSLVGQRWTMT